jgi:hypothetical protein
MPKIKIISEQKKPFCPTNRNLNDTVPRFRPPGGKPPLQLEKSYNRQAGINEKQPKTKG